MSSQVQQSSTLQQAFRQLTETTEYQKLLADCAPTRESSRSADWWRVLRVHSQSQLCSATPARRSRSYRNQLAIWNPGNAIVRFWYSALSGKESSDDEILVLPASEIDPYAGISPHAQTLERRALALWQLQQTLPELCSVDGSRSRSQDRESRSQSPKPASFYDETKIIHPRRLWTN